MNFLLKAVIFCCLAASVLSAAVPSRHYPEGTYQPSVQGWKKTNKPVSPHRLVELQILLKRRNLDKLEERFWAVSDPTNPDYGKYMTLEQIADLIAPTEKEINVVQEWLSSFNVKHSLLKSRDWIVAEATVAQVEALFGVKYSLYIHKSGRRVSATVDSYSVPMELKDVIEEVSGIFGLPTMKKSGPRIGMGGVGPMAITPVQIRARYNVTSDLIVTNKTNLHACSEFQGQYYSPSDLQQFFSQYVTTPNVVDTVDKVIGFNNPQQPQLEGSLDVQYLMGVAPNATTWFYTMKAFNFYSDLKTWLGWLNNETVIPSVMTVSYGSQGDYPSTSYQQSSDVEYQKLGLRGLSVIYASGDSGAGCSGNQRLAPSYPAISVYVTSVGATRFIKGNSGEEAAVQAFGSGGGFAWTTPMPSYQQTAVQAYLSSGVTLPPAAKFNASNRATPDVAALGAEHFLVINGGGVTPVGGTSASAPTFGAIITLLNDIRLNNNKPTLGFLNPWLYQTAAADATAFFDVTVGNNFSGCFQQGQSGYQCAPGWDPVTGLGTPNFEVLQNYV